MMGWNKCVPPYIVSFDPLLLIDLLTVRQLHGLDFREGPSAIISPLWYINHEEVWFERADRTIGVERAYLVQMTPSWVSSSIHKLGRANSLDRATIANNLPGSCRRYFVRNTPVQCDLFGVSSPLDQLVIRALRRPLDSQFLVLNNIRRIKREFQQQFSSRPRARGTFRRHPRVLERKSDNRLGTNVRFGKCSRFVNGRYRESSGDR